MLSYAVLDLEGAGSGRGCCSVVCCEHRVLLGTAATCPWRGGKRERGSCRQEGKDTKLHLQEGVWGQVKSKVATRAFVSSSLFIS